MLRQETFFRQNGFTLVEMAIVLLIIALLLGGLLPTISSQVEQRKVNETRKQLEEIQQALIGFAITNKRLPCPADPTIADGLANAGIEKASCAVGANGGVLPWVTLGVSETDAWGRRFTYRVTPAFATATPAFQLTTAPNLIVGLTPGASNVANGVPAIIVSHGGNGLGGYTTDGTLMPLPAATSDEYDNTVSDNDNNFVNHDPAATPGNEFDDLVVWISPNTLFNRMVAAGKLP